MLGPVGRLDVWIGRGIEGGRCAYRIEVKRICERNDILGQAATCGVLLWPRG